MHRPKTAEVELSFLDRIVRNDAVTVDVGANCGLYTRELARLSRRVHAFEPSRTMADVLRRTSAPNVIVHEIALSDHEGAAELLIPQSEQGAVHGLASLEPQVALSAKSCTVLNVPMARLDEVIQDDVAFVKVDVEGHELNVLNGAIGLLERSQPIFLVEAEDRHRPLATESVFEFFQDRGYSGFFVEDGDIVPVDQFDVEIFQDPNSLLSNGGRKTGQAYINNFFFFPPGKNGSEILAS
ncbi:MAG: FkbM family methyltransferase [Afipia sp.]|nr:FkbM family methyltransferase [Afipia sp.]